MSEASILAEAGAPIRSRFALPGLRPSVQVGLLILMFVIVAVPLSVLVLTSFLPRGILPFQAWSLTLDNYRDAFLRPGTGQILLNTFGFAGGSVVVGVGLGIAIAFITERTDLPGRTLVRIVMFSWMAVPPLIFGYGWIMLLNPGNGVINVVLQALFGLKTAPLTPYSLSALVFIAGMSLAPTAFVMIGGLLRNMDPTLEDAAFVLGASRPRILWRITGPILTPGILSVAIFLIMAMLQSFDLPMIIGMTARIPVLSTRIFTAAAPDTGLPHYGLAAAFGVCLLALAAALMFIYFRAVGASERFRTVTGKGFRPRLTHLKAGSRLAAYAGISGYFLIMLMPLLILAWTSLFPYYRLPAFSEVSNASLESYRAVLAQPQTVRVFANSIVLLFATATSVVLISCLVSWFAVRGGGWAGRALDVLAFAPMAVPPIVMAVAILLLFLGTPINGTIWVIVIGQLSIFVAFGTRTMNSALIQIHKELEDAALVSGTTWMTSLRRILFPMVLPQVLNAWLWVAAQSVRDLTFPLMLLTGTNVVAASAIYLRWDFPDLSGAAALSMLVIFGLMLFVVPAQIYLVRRTDRNS